MNPMTNIQSLHSEFDQSVWLDYFHPDLVKSHGLNALMLDGVRGAIGNPAMFYKAVNEGSTYDSVIADLIQTDSTIDNETLYQWLAMDFAQTAADILLPVYESGGGNDGFVSLELSPQFAYDTQATIDAARHLWGRIKRNNFMIKIPATRQGIQALEVLIAEDINVNMTHLFFLEDYKEVVQAYLRGLARNPHPLHVRSVASFYMEPLDRAIDSALEGLEISEVQVLKGKAAVAGAKNAYQVYKEILISDEFKLQQQRGAQMQRLLWSDTSPRNPQYGETFYVEQLIGPGTVSAMSPETLDAFILRGDLLYTLDNDLEAAQRIPSVLSSLEIDLFTVSVQLQEESIDSITSAHRAIYTALDKKRLKMVEEYA